MFISFSDIDAITSLPGVFEAFFNFKAFFIKKALKLKKASKTPGKEVIASISEKDINQIAQDKINDLNTDNVESAKKMVAGTARSMGIKVEKWKILKNLN